MSVLYFFNCASYAKLYSERIALSAAIDFDSFAQHCGRSTVALKISVPEGRRASYERSN
jgi:hypothetical protein